MNGIPKKGVSGKTVGRSLVAEERGWEGGAWLVLVSGREKG